MSSVVIVGGGPAGLAAALVLASGAGKHKLDLSISVIDEGHSDILSAELHCTPGFPVATSGAALLDTMCTQVGTAGVAICPGKVVTVSGETTPYHVTCADGRMFSCDFVVLATGFKSFSIEIPGALQRPHPGTPKPRPCLVLDERGQVKSRLYAAGTIAGVHSMLACAIGSGTEVACRILGDLTGQPTFVHDVPKG